jgi:hypothetical protein
MWLDVVADQLRGIGNQAPAELAGEQIPHQN